MLALGHCVPCDDGGCVGYADYYLKYFASFLKIFCAEILARVLTNGADATVVAEIHSWIEYFDFLD